MSLLAEVFVHDTYVIIEHPWWLIGTVAAAVLVFLALAVAVVVIWSQKCKWLTIR